MLEDDVIGMYAEGYNMSRIAKECNKLLEDRDDDVTYVPLNHVNVKMYLASFQKALDTAGSTQSLAIGDKAPKIFEKLTNMTNILEAEIDKLRNMEGAVEIANREFFLSLLKRLEDAISLASNLAGKLNSGTNITIITKSIENLTTKILDSDELPDKAKGVVLELVQKELLKDVALMNRNKIYIVTYLFLILFACQSYTAIAETDKTVINVYYDNIIGPVNKDLFGNNIVAYTDKYYKGLYRDRGAGIWDPQHGVPVNEFVAASKKAGITVFRWPGGRGARHFEWKKSVGPLENRTNQKFGLPEFLLFCEKAGAKPVITLPATISAQDIADLVEYLNVDNSKTPNVDVDWAKTRVADGRVTPWNVVWFELGNETFHTEMPSEDYAKRYSRTQEIMKSISPDVKLGALLEDSGIIENGWTHTVLKSLGSDIDFVVIHPYILKLKKNISEDVPIEKVALAALSADMDLTWRLNRYHKAIKDLTGDENIPIAVTEYNGLFVQDKPIPYRHTLLNALHNADSLRVFLDPLHKIMFATYWQFSNSYWGIVRGGLRSKDPIVKQPMQYVFEIYNRYLGNNLIDAKVESGVFDFEGILGISSRKGIIKPAVSEGYLKDLPETWSRRYFSDGDQEQSDGVIKVNFSGDKKVNYHHAIQKIKVEPDTLYIITVKARAKNISNGKVGIAVQETKTNKNGNHQLRNTYLTGTTDWQDVTVLFKTSYNAREIILMARNHGDGKLMGTAEFSKVTVEKIQENFGAVPYITSIASMDKNNIYLIIMNKNINSRINVELVLNPNGSMFHPVAATSIIGKSIYSTNLNDEEVKLFDISKDKIMRLDNNKFSTRIEPSSIMGIRFSKDK